MLTKILDAWRDKPSWVDFIILFGLAVAGMMHWPHILIAFAAGLLAASPVWKYVTMAREKPHIDARHVVKDISIEVIGYAVIASIAAYVVGRLTSMLFFA